MIIASMAGADMADDGHPGDGVMPGFRFHPSEEELIEFYLRRKVEGRRFNVELVTFVDLYRYDPWELPSLAAIGDKEWFFYVPRDKKYRNGDRPNRVTPSGYWKATGADRVVRAPDQHNRSIGLKKTLVFYTGKAPKGTRSSWIMNEYRLPHGDPPDRSSSSSLLKVEISLCRVYKRSGIEEKHPPVTKPAAAPTSKRTATPASAGAGRRPTSPAALPCFPAAAISSSSSYPTAASLSKATAQLTPAHVQTPPAAAIMPAISIASLGSTTSTEEDGAGSLYLKAGAASSAAMDELSRVIGYSVQTPTEHSLADVVVHSPPSALAFPSSDKIWEWNPFSPETSPRSAFD